eukprot:Awhi_evm1s13920
MSESHDIWRRSSNQKRSSRSARNNISPPSSSPKLEDVTPPKKLNEFSSELEDLAKQVNECLEFNFESIDEKVTDDQVEKNVSPDSTSSFELEKQSSFSRTQSQDDLL